MDDARGHGSMWPDLESNIVSASYSVTTGDTDSLSMSRSQLESHLMFSRLDLSTTSSGTRRMMH